MSPRSVMRNGGMRFRMTPCAISFGPRSSRTTTCALPRHGSWRRARCSASLAQTNCPRSTRRHPSSTNGRRRPPGDPPSRRARHRSVVLTRVGAGFLGQVPTRHRVCSRQPSLRRVGTASNHQFARQRCGERLFPVARTGPRTGDLPPDARVAKRLAALDPTACGPRRHVHARRAAGRTTRVRRGRLDP